MRTLDEGSVGPTPDDQRSITRGDTTDDACVGDTGRTSQEEAARAGEPPTVLY